MSGPRDIVHPPEMQDLKVASNDLRRAYGSQASVEALTGYDQRRVSDFGLPNTPEFMPVDMVRALEARTVGLPGWPHVTRTLARLNGFVLVPEAAARGEGDLTDHMCTVTGEAADVMRALAEANRGGLTAERRTVALTQARELAEAASSLIALLEGGQ